MSNELFLPPTHLFLLRKRIVVVRFFFSSPRSRFPRRQFTQGVRSPARTTDIERTRVGGADADWDVALRTVLKLDAVVVPFQ